MVTYIICLFRSFIDVSAAGLSQQMNRRIFLERPAADTSIIERNKQIKNVLIMLNSVLLISILHVPRANSRAFIMGY